MISEGTKLMNLIIALQAKNHGSFPTPLYDEGYVLEGIETKFNITDKEGDSREVVPELQLKSDKENNLLFVECKAGSVEKDQLERYKLISQEAIKEGKITSLDSGKDINFDLMYLGPEEKKDKLIQSIEKDENHYPIVIRGGNKLKLYLNDKGNNKFRSPTLNKVFEEIEIKNAPISYVPFTTDDKIEFVMLAILREIYTFINGEEFTVEQLIKAIFKERYGCISPQYISRLKTAVNKTLKKMREKHLNDYLFVNNNKWTIAAKTPKSFITACEKIKEEMEDRKYMAPLSRWT